MVLWCCDVVVWCGVVMTYQLELKEMIERADDDCDGVINKKEFLALMKLKHPQ